MVLTLSPFIVSCLKIPSRLLHYFLSLSTRKLFCYQQNETGRNDIGQLNVAFSDNNIDIRINDTQSLIAGENQEQNDDEDNLTSKDMLSFSWQIAQGMVSKN